MNKLVIKLLSLFTPLVLLPSCTIVINNPGDNSSSAVQSQTFTSSYQSASGQSEFTNVSSEASSVSSSREGLNLIPPKTRANLRNPSLDGMVTYRSDDYYYYVFDLGTYYNIPVEGSITRYEYRANAPMKETVTVSSAESSTIRESASQAYSNTITAEATLSISLKFQFGFNVEELQSLGAEIEEGFSVTIGSSTTNSWSQTFESASTYSKSSQHTREISFDADDPKGNYYYYFAVDTTVYGVLVKDLISGEYYATTFSKVVAQAFNFSYAGDDFLDCRGFYSDLSLELDWGIVEQVQDIVPANRIVEKSERDGSEEKPYLVENATELYSCLNNSGEGDHYALDCDIDLSGLDWQTASEFKGVLDGKGHTISGLKVTDVVFESANYRHAGLVRENSGEIKNIHFKNPMILVTSYFNTKDIYEHLNAGIVGYNKGTIKNVWVDHFSAVLNLARQTDGYNEWSGPAVRAGAVCAVNYGTVSYCYAGWPSINSWAIAGQTRAIAYNEIGGIVGINEGSIDNCLAVGVKIFASITSGNSGGDWDREIIYVGGIVGTNRSGRSVSYCVAYNFVSLEYELNWLTYGMAETTGRLGLIVGDSAGTVEQCYGLKFDGCDRLVGGSNNGQYTSFVKENTDDIARVTALWAGWAYENGEFRNNA